jgi:hypothetical protein
MNSITLTTEKARELFRIDPETGKIHWAVEHGRWGTLPAGTLAGCLRKGYRYIGIDGRNYFGHQIAWLIEYGTWPVMRLDHINGDRDDNRPANLRLATTAENNQNQHGLPAHNTSGERGVSWDGSRDKWTAHISVDGKPKNLGRFDSKDQAAEAYREAKRVHHPRSQEARQ